MTPRFLFNFDTQNQQLRGGHWHPCHTDGYDLRWRNMATLAELVQDLPAELYNIILEYTLTTDDEKVTIDEGRLSFL